MARLLVFKTDSFDTDSLIEDILDYSKDSVVHVLGFDRKITTVHTPEGRRNEVLNLFSFRSEKLNKALSPVLFLFDMASFSRLIFGSCIRHRPRFCWIENTFAAAIAGLFRKLGLCGEVIYLPGDWFMPEGRGAGLRKYLWGVLFIAADYAACRSSSLVLNTTERITEARQRFWGKSIAAREGLYTFNMKVKAVGAGSGEGADAASGTGRRKICFLGNIREDSGLEVIFRSLARIGEVKDIGIKIIGPAWGHERVRRLSEEFGIAGRVEVLGFVDRKDLPSAVSDCFCGVNLLTDPKSYSSYTIPSKIVHYLQFLLPVITTRGAGEMAGVIRDRMLGLVIRPEEDEFVEAVIEVHSLQDEFRRNISAYIKGLPKVELSKLLGA